MEDEVLEILKDIRDSLARIADAMAPETEEFLTNHPNVPGSEY